MKKQISFKIFYLGHDLVTRTRHGGLDVSSPVGATCRWPRAGTWMRVSDARRSEFSLRTEFCLDREISSSLEWAQEGDRNQMMLRYQFWIDVVATHINVTRYHGRVQRFTHAPIQPTSSHQVASPASSSSFDSDISPRRVRPPWSSAAHRWRHTERWRSPGCGRPSALRLSAQRGGACDSLWWTQGGSVGMGMQLQAAVTWSSRAAGIRLKRHSLLMGERRRVPDTHRLMLGSIYNATLT